MSKLTSFCMNAIQNLLDLFSGAILCFLLAWLPFRGQAGYMELICSADPSLWHCVPEIGSNDSLQFNYNKPSVAMAVSNGPFSRVLHGCTKSKLQDPSGSPNDLHMYTNSSYLHSHIILATAFQD